MDKKEDLEDLIGRTIDNRYKLQRLIRETSKSLVFEAVEEGESSPHRSVALKILRPGLGREREAQFSREVDRLANLEEHPNITTMYGAGRDGKYFYVAMELVPGKDLEQEIRDGRTFSLEEILNIMTDVTGAVSHINEKTGGHQDLKLKNIEVREEKIQGRTERTYVLDLGGRLRITEDSKDIFGMGSILRELLNHRKDPEEKIPKGLEQIVEKSSGSEGYASPGDFKNAIESYKEGVRKSISRRKFLKVTGSVGLGSIASIYGINRYMKYSRTHHKLEDIIHEIQLTEHFNNFLYEDLLHELYIVKIVPLIETVPKNQFPSKVDESGKYQTAPNSYNDQGEWIRVVALGFLITGEESYLTEAIERNRFLEITRDGEGKLTEMDDQGINLTRIVRANTFLINLIEQSGLEERDHNYRDIKNDLNSELRGVLDIFNENKYREFELGGYFIMSPFDESTLGIYEGRSVIRSGAINILEGMWRFGDEALKDRAFSHIGLSNRCLFRDDGSVIDAVLIDGATGNFAERNLFGTFSGDFESNELYRSCYNWTLMDLLMGMEHAYPYLNNEDKQITANNIRRSLDFYIKNFISVREKGFFRERFILPIDFYDPRLQNKETWSEIKINNYPLVLSLRVLSDAIDIIEEEEFRNTASDILVYTARDLTRCISTSKDIQGIIEGASDTERHLGDDLPSYYMQPDANYLEYLHHLIKK